jgi:hypothetical protein
MVKERWNMLMEPNLKGDGERIRPMAMALCFIPMGIDMKAIGRKERNKATEEKPMFTAVNMMVNGKEIKNMGREPFCIQQNIKSI